MKSWREAIKGTGIREQGRRFLSEKLKVAQSEI